MTIAAKLVHFAGRVQGVGFRYSTRQIATGFDVIGTVKNLADGRVEMYVRGEDIEVDEFIEELRENSNLSHHILECEIEDLEPTQMDDVKGFSIIGA